MATELEKFRQNYLKMLKSEFYRMLSLIYVQKDATKQRFQEMCNLCAEGLQADDWYAVGGEALVLRVRNTKLDVKCILKIPKQEIAENPRKKSRFMRGATIQMRLSRNILIGIPKVYELNYDPVFMMMEYVPGKAFLDYLQSVPYDEGIRIFCLVLELIGMVHEYGIVHRDIKPDNFIITKSPLTGEPIPTLLDYGLAKSMELDDKQLLTGMGAELGTPIFSSDEQLEDAARATYADDIFSLGRLFYVVLTYKVNGLPVDMEDFNESLLEGKYLEVYQKALAPKELRFKTAEQFLTVLREVSGIKDTMFGTSQQSGQPETPPLPSMEVPADSGIQEEEAPEKRTGKILKSSLPELVEVPPEILSVTKAVEGLAHPEAVTALIKLIKLVQEWNPEITELKE